MQGTNVGLTVWVFGRDAATIMYNNSHGAIVRYEHNQEDVWLPWSVLWKVPDENPPLLESQVGYNPHDGIRVTEYGDHVWGDDL